MASASINDIKSRIKSVEGTMQITKAMELVATSKLRHAKARAENAKPYLSVLKDAIASLATDGANANGKTLIIVIAGDRGLAGGYNSNIMKLSSGLDKNGEGIYLPVGKKACEALSRRGCEILTDSMHTVAAVGVGDCMRIGEMICEEYLSGRFSKVCLIYTRFASMLTQIPTCEQLLPLENKENTLASEPIFEGDCEQLLGRIVPQYVGGILYAAISESAASECAARRSAMNSANKNAEEMINSLTLSFNRARQAVITQEITEIVSGAEAL